MSCSWSAAAQKAEILEALASDYGVSPSAQEALRSIAQRASDDRGETSPPNRLPARDETAVIESSTEVATGPAYTGQPENSGHLAHIWNADPLQQYSVPEGIAENDQLQQLQFDFSPGLGYLDDNDSQMLQMLLDRVSVPHAQIYPFQPGLLAPSDQLPNTTSGGPAVNQWDGVWGRNTYQ